MGKNPLIVEGLVEDFPASVGKSGASGASGSAFSQNTGFAMTNLLTRPQVIEGDDDFEILVEPLAPSLDMSTAARDIKIKTVLNTWEFLRVYA
jgi:hypothetical protein